MPSIQNSLRDIIFMIIESILRTVNLETYIVHSQNIASSLQCNERILVAFNNLVQLNKFFFFFFFFKKRPLVTNVYLFFFLCFFAKTFIARNFAKTEIIIGSCFL